MISGRAMIANKNILFVMLVGCAPRFEAYWCQFSKKIDRFVVGTSHSGAYILRSGDFLLTTTTAEPITLRFVHLHGVKNWPTICTQGLIILHRIAYSHLWCRHYALINCNWKFSGKSTYCYWLTEQSVPCQMPIHTCKLFLLCWSRYLFVLYLLPCSHILQCW